MDATLAESPYPVLSTLATMLHVSCDSLTTAQRNDFLQRFHNAEWMREFKLKLLQHWRG